MYDLRPEKFFFVFCLLLLNKLLVISTKIENLLVMCINWFNCYNQYSKKKLLLSIALMPQYRHIIMNKLAIVITSIKIRGLQKQFIYRKFIVIFCISVETIFNRILYQAMAFSDSLYVKNFNKTNPLFKS